MTKISKRDEQTAAVLDHAAEILERDGWVKGSMGVAGGARCAVGAIYGAVEETCPAGTNLRGARR